MHRWWHRSLPLHDGGDILSRRQWLHQGRIDGGGDQGWSNRGDFLAGWLGGDDFELSSLDSLTTSLGRLVCGDLGQGEVGGIINLGSDLEWRRSLLIQLERRRRTSRELCEKFSVCPGDLKVHLRSNVAW